MTNDNQKRIYHGVRTIFGRYWSAYGGMRAVLRSPYLHASLLLVALMAPYWTKPGWWELVIAVLPNLLGFSLGGYAIWLGLGDENFRAMISGADPEDGSDSPFLEVNASFVHFILVQFLALVVALVSKAWYFPLSDIFVLERLVNGFDVPWAELLPGLALFGWGLGFGLFLYALATALAATMAVFRVATWYELDQTTRAAKKSQKNEKKAANDEG